jgi:hypothetical protein
MRYFCCRSLLLALILLGAIGCVVRVPPVPVLEVHPLFIGIHH